MIRRALGILFCGGALTIVLLPVLVPVPSWWHAPDATEVLVCDRRGDPIDRISIDRKMVYRPVRIDEIDPLLIRATLAAEDRRFFSHPGIDPIALVRALVHSVRTGQSVRGASTLTMQAVRTARGMPTGLADRFVEVAWSLIVEVHVSKREILEVYFNRAPYGGAVVGVAAAADRWLGRSPFALSPAEAALLASLPRAPGRMHPRLHPMRARAGRDLVLGRMQRLGWIDSLAFERAKASDLPLPRVREREAPHFAEWVVASLAREGPLPDRIATTLDPDIQRIAGQALVQRMEDLSERNVTGGAVVVLSIPAEEILAMVGSPDYLEPKAGQVNAALCFRQPGSAVKPLLYCVAFGGELRPSTLLADVPVSYEAFGGVFAPRNYNGRFTGPISARHALAQSANVPAVEVLRAVGVGKVAARFESLGFPGIDPDRLGLGLALGVGEVRLLDLAAAYATLARGGRVGVPRPLPRRDEWVAAQDEATPMLPLLDPVACAWVNDILSDPAARAGTFGRGGPLELPAPIAAKTGTSSDWRDSWAVFYSTSHVVAVWMGNPDGSTTDHITGVEGPARVAHTIFRFLLERDGVPARFSVPVGTQRRAVCPSSGDGPSPDCPQIDWQPFRIEDPPLSNCSVHRARTIDTRTGLLARTCTPVERVRKVVFAQLPERFARWQADLGGPTPPTVATDCLCGTSDCGLLGSRHPIAENRGSIFSIRRPVAETVVALDPSLPEEQQQLALEANAPRDTRVIWSIDGKALGETIGSGRIYWRIARGRHVIRADLAGTEHASVREIEVVP